MDDEEVSVNGYEDDGAGGEEDTGGLGRTNQLAQDLLALENMRKITIHICIYLSIFSISQVTHISAQRNQQSLLVCKCQ